MPDKADTHWRTRKFNTFIVTVAADKKLKTVALAIKNTLIAGKILKQEQGMHLMKYVCFANVVRVTRKFPRYPM